jgi:hypothetical protein
MLPLPPFADATCRDTMQADQQGVPSHMLGLPRMHHVSSHPILPEEARGKWTTCKALWYVFLWGQALLVALERCFLCPNKPGEEW